MERIDECISFLAGKAAQTVSRLARERLAPYGITPVQYGVLQVLWEHGTATVRELTERTYPAQSESDYATVKTLLARLEAKGFVTRDRSRGVHSFAAAVERGDLIGRRRIGGAEVSARHANFFIAHPGAAAKDVLQLIDLVRNRVAERMGVELETEIEIW